MKGLLFSFDGVDSSGKATQTRLLVERLRFAGHEVHRFQTPDYDTTSGRELKRRLQNKLGNWQTTTWQEKLGYFATNRLEHREEVLEALAAGHVVIYDRYVPSSMTFVAVEALAQAKDTVARQEIYDHVQEVEYVQNKMPKENISIFLDVPPRVSAVLLEQRKEKLQDEDEYTDHISVQERLYAEYEFLCNNDPDRFFRVPCVKTTQLLDVVTVGELIWQGVLERYPDLVA